MTHLSLFDRHFQPFSRGILKSDAVVYYQQYLAKVPNGYCGLGGTGVSCEVSTGVALG